MEKVPGVPELENPREVASFAPPQANSLPNLTIPNKLDSFEGKLHFGTPAIAYALALGLVFVAGAARLMQGQHRMIAPFLLFYPVIAVSAFFGGIGPGLFSAIASAVLVLALFPPMQTNTPWIIFAILSPIFAGVFARFREAREHNASLEREYARFRFISDYASDWIFLVEGGLTQFERIRFVNQTACIHLGWTAEELTGQLLSKLVLGAEAERLGTLLMQTRQSASHPASFHFQRRDGSEVPVEIACAAVRTGGELVIHVVARDVSDRVINEQRLREAQHWESLGALAGGLAHDFNNLLTSMVGNTSLAKELLPAGHATIPLLDSALEAGERTAELVRLMLASSGYPGRQPQEVRLDKILQELVAAGKLPSNILVKTAAEPVRFLCDVRSIQTLLANLLMNAAEAYCCGINGQQADFGPAVRKDAPVEVTVETISRRVVQPWHGQSAPGEATFEEGSEPEGDVLRIVVEDWGCGMTQEVLDRAFQPFYSTKFTGRGLGLAAVRGIVRSCDGKIRLQTAAGIGTRVEVTFPLRPHVAQKKAAAAASPAR